MSNTQTYRVTIKDIVAWTTVIRAAGSLEAEQQAWELFQATVDRSEVFEEDSDTTTRPTGSGSGTPSRSGRSG